MTIFNPDENVIVRLYESSNNSHNSIEVPSSKTPTRVNVRKTAISNHIQLVIISRKKQTYFADNFVITKN